MWTFLPWSSFKKQIEQILAEIRGVQPARPPGRLRSCVLQDRDGEPSCLVLHRGFQVSHQLLHLAQLYHPWYPTRSEKGCMSSSLGLLAFELLNF